MWNTSINKCSAKRNNKRIKELEKFPLAKRILVENKVDNANDKIIELLTELELTFLVETAEEDS